MAPPIINSLSRSGGPMVGGTIVVITGSGFTADDLLDIIVSFGANLAVTANVDSATQITALSPPGNGIVNVSVTTPNGTSLAGAASMFTFSSAAVPPPTVSSLSPAAGPRAGGEEITISGSGFLGAISVNFGPMVVPAPKVLDDTRLVVTCPPLDPSLSGSVRVSVTTPAGVSAPSGSDIFVYLEPPTVTMVSPNLGSPTGATPVLILGTNLALATEVRFGVERAIALNVVDDTQLTVMSPPGNAGDNVPVTVVSPGGTSAPHDDALFLYTGAGIPVVTQVSPAYGGLGGDNLVTVAGSGMTDALAVRFGGVGGANLIVNSDFQIDVETPAASVPGVVDVIVSGPGGFSYPSNDALFTYLAPPTVSAITPSYCSVAGGETIYIKGTGFVPGSTVLIGGVVVTPIEIDQAANEITVVTPQRQAGVVDVQVQTPGGTSAANPFAQLMYIDAPQITGLTPNHGPGGTTVRISGLRLDTVYEVLFGSDNATFTYDAVAGQLVAKSPGGSGEVDIALIGYGGAVLSTPQTRYTYD